MLKALPSRFPNLLGTSSSTRVESADGYDRDFMKKSYEDLNTTLIFVSTLFAYTSVPVLTRFSWDTGRSVPCRFS